MQRNQKLVSLIYLACGVIAWALCRELTATVWAIAHFAQPVDWVVPPSEIVAILFGIAVFIVLLTNKKVNEFTNDTITELGKVAWPQRKETALSTGVVSILVAIASCVLFLFDMLWGALVKVFYT